MGRISVKTKRISAFLAALLMIFSVVSFYAVAVNEYSFRTEGSALVCEYNGAVQKNKMLFVACVEGEYSVVSSYGENTVLYSFDENGNGSAFSGVYEGKYYTDGVLTNGWQTVGKKTYYCKNGVCVKGIQNADGKIYYFNKDGSKSTKSGWKTVNGKKYYFGKKGVAKTGWAVIDEKCYYFNSKAQMVKDKKVDGIKLNKSGVATGPIKKLVPLHAKLVVENITKPSQSKSKKLKICFDYVIKTYKSNGNPRIPHYTKKDWIYVYANDMFGERGGGNCFSYAAAFAFLAKECGYDKVYACNSGGHGWVEINNKVYDPEQYKDVGRKIYGLSYSDKRISNYKKAISNYKSEPWMRVRIPG